MIRILGIHGSFGSNPTPLAVRFLVREGADEDDGEEDDMSLVETRRLAEKGTRF